MKHMFDADVAKAHGVNAAIVFQNIAYLCEYNRMNETNYHDGNYWTFNSRKAFSEQHPYLTEKQIRTALDKLVKSGLLAKGNYNKYQFDKTSWYALTDEGRVVYTAGQIDWPLRSNALAPEGQGTAPEGQPIPYINTNINTDINVSKNPTDSCPEPEESASTPTELPVISLPLNDGTEHPVTKEDFDKYVALYPSVDVMQQLRNMYGWLDSHRNRRKTRSGIKGFITTWLAKEQDRSMTRQPAQLAQPAQPQPNAFGLDRRNNKVPERYGGGIIV